MPLPISPSRVQPVALYDNAGAPLELTDLIVLPSAARTATVTSADIVNRSFRGALLFLNVTVASGTGGLQVRWRYKDPISGEYQYMNTAPTAITATGLAIYGLYPAALANGNQMLNQILPRTWQVQVQHGNSSSYTYSVGAVLLP